MKNRNLLIVLLIIVAVLAGGWAKSYYDARQIGAEPTVFDKNEDVAKTTEFEDGEYIVDLGMSQMFWEASKVLIPGYTDKGQVNLSVGGFLVEGGTFKSGSFDIDMSSIVANSTGSGKGQDGLSNHLKSADFFDVEKFPVANFKLNSVEPTDEERKYLVYGDLTVKGITNEINFVAEIFSTPNNSVKILARTVLDRTMWDIKFGSGKFFQDLGNNVIDDNFVMEFDLTAVKK